jgi:hypothetical protein
VYTFTCLKRIKRYPFLLETEFSCFRLNSVGWTIIRNVYDVECNRKVRPKHVSALKFVTVVTYVYATVIFPIVYVARYVAELVDQNEPARFSPRQKNIADLQKIYVALTKIMCVQDFSDHQQFLSDRQPCFSDRRQFFTVRHPHDHRAGLCFTLRHHNAKWRQFSQRGFAWVSAFSRFFVHGQTFQEGPATSSESWKNREHARPHCKNIAPTLSRSY